MKRKTVPAVATAIGNSMSRHRSFRHTCSACNGNRSCTSRLAASAGPRRRSSEPKVPVNVDRFGSTASRSWYACESGLAILINSEQCWNHRRVRAGLIRIYLSRAKGSAVLLLGPSGSGKTTLFLQLRDGDIHNGTVASMQENTGSFTLSTEQARIFD